MPKAKNFSLPQKERLYLRSHINQLQTEPQKSFIAFPLLVMFRTFELDDNTHESPLSVLISVPKRRYKHAVDRNLLKRRTREAYRLNKDLFHQLSDSLSIGIHLSFHMVDSKRPSYKDIEKGILKAAHKLESLLPQLLQEKSEEK